MISILCATYMMCRHPKAYEDCYAFVLFFLLGLFEMLFEGIGLLTILGVK